MRKVIHATIDEEHEALRIDEKRTFAVRLSLALEDVPAGDEVKAAYAQFITDVGALANAPESFAAYAWDGTNLTTLAADRYSVISEPHNAALETEFQTWLNGRLDEIIRAANKQSAGVGAAAAAVDGEVSESELTGFHVLMGAAGWPAPIPHELGLVHLITVNAGDLPDGHRLAVVPLVGGVEIDATSPPAGGNEWIDATLKDSAYSSCCASLSAPLPADPSLLLGDDGFFKETLGGEVFGQTIRRIEQRGGSLFTGYLAAGEINWSASAPDEARFDLGCLAWQAATLVGAAFDTLLLALLMPGFDRRDGQSLAPFLDNLVRVGLHRPEAAGAAQPTLADKSESERRKAFREGIRTGLGKAVDALTAAMRNAPASPPDDKD